MDAPAKKSKLIKGATGDWEVVIGMEVHAQVTSKAKLFSGASTEFGGEPNSHVSLVDAAMPGMLPVINEECVRQAVRTGFWLNAKPNLKSIFDRKNYFYPDLPQGYQISQYKFPIVGEGFVTVLGENGEPFNVGIERLHLEQDAGKSLHDQYANGSLVDLNRSGVALMEIVTKPDLRSAVDAALFFARMRMLLQHLGVCDGDMEHGNLRADVNVSLHRLGTPFGTRCEIKNLNSFHFVSDAVMWEQDRQKEILEDGGTIVQETRLFDPNTGQTRPMRTKEEAHDYRYFPDPDLLPLELTQEFVDTLRAQLPEHPDDRRKRYQSELGLSIYDAGVLLNEKARTDEFEKLLALAPKVSPKALANWLINEHLGRLNKEKLTLETSPIPVAANAAIVELIAENVISGRTAKELYDRIWQANTGGQISGHVSDAAGVRSLVASLGLQQVTDVGALEKLVDDIVAGNPDKVADAKTNPKAIGWFVGQVMKASDGKANPQAVNALLKKRIGL
ncbi:MAG TPA: Asp-tRNA(Asn)/Glu-tRNA(Gln) amidotransferase subunit GatB [Xanthobacteraceae bacterium]|nr:Asp-tRNA(Asn)/Glu-tRNA(Gln) amidotransferase subunit GatB [Xanthobacteraceae bacterium]